MVLLGDKVGGNIDMAGNGHIGTEKNICEKFCITQRKATKKRKISQLLGLQTYLVKLFLHCNNWRQGRTV